MNKSEIRRKIIAKLSKKVRKEGFVKSTHKSFPDFNIKKLKKEYGNNKIIPKEYEQQILTALSYYPELKNEKISFVLANSIFSMETRFKALSFFREKRHYVIIIKKRTADIYFKKFSSETVTALLCHELAHVVDYKNKSRKELLLFPIKYILPGTRQKIELETELRSFYHGAGHFMIIYYDEFTNNLDLLVKRKKLKNYTKYYHNKYYLRKSEMIYLMSRQ